MWKIMVNRKNFFKKYLQNLTRFQILSRCCNIYFAKRKRKKEKPASHEHRWGHFQELLQETLTPCSSKMLYLHLSNACFIFLIPFIILLLLLFSWIYLYIQLMISREEKRKKKESKYIYLSSICMLSFSFLTLSISLLRFCIKLLISHKKTQNKIKKQNYFRSVN